MSHFGEFVFYRDTTISKKLGKVTSYHRVGGLSESINFDVKWFDVDVEKRSIKPGNIPMSFYTNQSEEEINKTFIFFEDVREVFIHLVARKYGL